MSRVDSRSLFFSPESDSKDFNTVLHDVQEYIASKYSTLIVSGGSDDVKEQVKRYIRQYLLDYRIAVKDDRRAAHRRALC
jgi:pilus assembly protein CpaF